MATRSQDTEFITFRVLHDHPILVLPVEPLDEDTAGVEEERDISLDCFDLVMALDVVSASGLDSSGISMARAQSSHESQPSGGGWMT